jgi:hypothetical protein
MHEHRLTGLSCPFGEESKCILKTLSHRTCTCHYYVNLIKTKFNRVGVRCNLITNGKIAVKFGIVKKLPHLALNA